MNKTEFEEWLQDNKWWNAEYYFDFTEEKSIIQGNTKYNEMDIMFYLKEPIKGGEKLKAIYRVEEIDNGLKLHVEGINGEVEFFERRFLIHLSSGATFGLNQYLQHP